MIYSVIGVHVESCCTQLLEWSSTMPQQFGGGEGGGGKGGLGGIAGGSGEKGGPSYGGEMGGLGGEHDSST